MRRKRVMAALLWTAVGLAEAGVSCRIDYGGETFSYPLPETVDPYQVQPHVFGSYFLFRGLVERFPGQQPLIKLYVYSDRDPSPGMLHQATYPYPPGQENFTGEQRVYEPIRDGELLYICRYFPGKGRS